MNFALFLTLLRVFATPLVAAVYFLPFHYAHLAAGIIFGIAALTDLVDGWVARHLKQTTKLGAFLDPVADKILVTTALVIFIGQATIPFLTLPAAVIVGREIAVSAVREWMAELGKRTQVAVNLVAKYKTALQMFAIGFLLSYTPGTTWGVLFGWVGSILLYVSAMLTLWSMFVYLKAAWPDLTSR